MRFIFLFPSSWGLRYFPTLKPNSFYYPIEYTRFVVFWLRFILGPRADEIPSPPLFVLELSPQGHYILLLAGHPFWLPMVQFFLPLTFV